MYLLAKPEESVELRVKFIVGIAKMIGSIIIISINTLKIKFIILVLIVVLKLEIKVPEDMFILLEIIKDLSITKLRICGEWLKWMKICASMGFSLQNTSVTDTLDFWEKNCYNII